jgi:hypothetical protein
MRLFSAVERSIAYGMLGALVQVLLLCGTAAAQSYPYTTCSGDNCSFWATASGNSSGGPTATYNKRGKFTILDSGKVSQTVDKDFSLIIGNGYGDVYFFNLLRNRDNYQIYRGYSTYRGFSLSGCRTNGEALMMRIKATPSMPEHISLMSTSWRWDTTMYILNDVFRPLTSTIYSGYENWYPFDMTCSVAMYVSQGGFSQ